MTWIAINGEVFSPEQAKIPALDRGFLFGDNCFESMVVFGGKILDLEDHLARLAVSAAQIQLSLPWSIEQIAAELSEFAASQPIPKAGLRYVVTRGSGLGLHVPKTTECLRVAYLFPAPVEPEITWEKGLALSCQKHPRFVQGPTAKTGNYLDSIIALKSAQAKKFDDVLWINARDEITESTTSNIFFIRMQPEPELITPTLGSGLLRGITRTKILRLAAGQGIKTTERVISLADLSQFSETLICSTIRGIVPVTRIDEQAFNTLSSGSLYHRIRQWNDTELAQKLGYPVHWNTGLPR